MPGKEQNTEATSIQNAAASTLSTGNAIANQVQEGADQAQELRERIDSKVANTNETLSGGSASVAEALTFKSYTDENVPLRAQQNEDGEWVATKEVAKVNLRQGTFSKKIKEGDVTMERIVISAKDLGPTAHYNVNGSWESDEGGLLRSETVENRYQLGQDGDGNLDASLDQIDISDGRGLLSKMVKFKSWLGVDDSTFLTFIKKVEEFNSSSDIILKKEAYEKVINQGYAWLVAFTNLNNKKANKKRAIIHEIISGSISNFAEVELTYLAFEDAYKSFTADPSIDILDPSDFNGIDVFKKLREFIKQKNIWEKQHNSPVKNRMHSDEKEAMEKIKNLGTLEIKSSGDYNIIPGVLKISAPTLKIENLGKKITISSGISLAKGVNFETAKLNASGEFTVEINNFKIATTTLEKGKVTGSFLNQNFKIEGVDYSTSEKDKISASSAAWNGKILTKDGSITFNNPSISNAEGFTFTTAVGTLNELNFGNFVKSRDIEIHLIKEGKNRYNITGTSNVAAEASLPGGFAKANLAGLFTLKRDANKVYNCKIENGELSTAISGQTLNLHVLNYDSSENPNLISATSAEFILNIFGETGLNPVITQPRIDENGFDFKSAEINTANLLKTDLGAFSLKANKLTLLKKESEGYEAKVDGKISLNLGENSPIELAGNADGAITYNFKSHAKKVDFKKAEVEIPNPFSLNLPTDLGIPWPVEITMGIPIFPGLNVEIGFYLDGNVQIAKKIKITIENNEDNLNVKISSKIVGELLAGILLGLQLGSSFLASLSVRLKGGGKLAVDTLVEFAKEFNYNNNVNNADKPNAHNFLYDTELIAKLEASLEIVGRLLYFFKKKYNKTIGEYEIGRYHFSNKPGADPTNIDPTKNDFTTKEDVGSKMDIPEGYTLEQIETMDQSTRFKNDEVTNITAAYQIQEGENLENRVSLLSSYGKFMQNRIDINSLSAIFNQHSNIDSSNRSELKEILKRMGPNINSKSDLIDKYGELINANENNNKIRDIVDAHKERKIFFEDANEFKSKFLHSGFWGDESIQSSSTNWFNRGDLREKYKVLTTSFENKNTALKKDLVTLENNYIEEIHKFKRSGSAEELENKIKASKSALAS